MNKLKLNIFVASFAIVMISGLTITSFNNINSVFASTGEPTDDTQISEEISNTNQTNNEQSNLETIDGFLEDCIEALENDNTDEALENCQSADEELDNLLENTTTEQ